MLVKAESHRVSLARGMALGWCPVNWHSLWRSFLLTSALLIWAASFLHLSAFSTMFSVSPASLKAWKASPMKMKMMMRTTSKMNLLQAAEYGSNRCTSRPHSCSTLSPYLTHCPQLPTWAGWWADQAYPPCQGRPQQLCSPQCACQKKASRRESI